MGSKWDIVGLAERGKSTLFMRLPGGCGTGRQFPFCTIRAECREVACPDARLTSWQMIAKSKTIIPTR